LAGIIPGPCPDPVVAAPALANAEAKLQATLFAACGGGDRSCGGGDDVEPAALGFAPACPAAPAAGPSCPRAGSARADVTTRADCVANATADCLSAVWAPTLGAYPAGCTDPVSLPPPAPPACPRLLEFTTGNDAVGSVDLGWTGIVHGLA